MIKKVKQGKGKPEIREISFKIGGNPCYGVLAGYGKDQKR